MSKFDWNLNSAPLLLFFLSSCKHGTVMLQFGYQPPLMGGWIYDSSCMSDDVFDVGMRFE